MRDFAPLRAAAALALSLASTLALALPARAAEPVPPWEGKPFSADPKAMLEAALKLPAPAEGVAIDLILEEYRVVYDAEGRRTTTVRMVFRPLTAEAAKDWTLFTTGWAPWHQAQPEVKARTISPDGAVHELDPKTFSDQPARDQDSVELTDARELRGPLPAMAAGVLVEEQVVTRETAPAFRSGAAGAHWFGRELPVRRTLFSVEAPSATPLVLRPYGLAKGPEKKSEAGVTRYTLNLGALEAQKRSEALTPGENEAWPHLRWTTAASWRSAAEEYAAVVEKQLAGVDAASLPGAPKPGPGARAEVAAKLLAALHAQIRYTGVEFGEAAIVPRPPAEVMARRYGDCKDLSTLLVAMLRAAGLPAEVALLNVSGDDALEGIPALSSFDHAIVVVPAAKGEPALWIDPTSPVTPAGRLPPHDQGRLALVAAKITAAPVRTPETPGAENLALEERDLYLAEFGEARLEVRLEGRGSPDEARRRGLQEVEPKALREIYDRFARGVFEGALDKVDTENLGDVEKPLRVKLALKASSLGATGLDDAFAKVPLKGLLQNVPDALFDSKPEQPDRRAPLRLQAPVIADLRQRIFTPPGYAVRDLPAAAATPLGAGSLVEEYEVQKDGVVLAHLRLDLSRRDWTAAQVNELRAALRKRSLQEPLELHFDTKGSIAQNKGRMREGLAEYRALIALHPKESLHQAQLAFGLLRAGAGLEAREAARAAVALEPQSALAQRTLGFVLQHDALGRTRRPGMDLAGAIAAFEKAKALEPKGARAPLFLAELYELDPTGRRYGPGAPLEKAAAEYKLLHDELKNTTGDDQWLDLLLRLGRSEELLKVAKEMPKSAARDGKMAAAAAISGGAKAAQDLIGRLGGEAKSRRESLELAGRLLLLQRRYPAAAELLALAAEGSEKPAELGALAAYARKLRPTEEQVLSDDDPAQVVQQLFRAAVTGKEFGALFKRLFATRLQSGVEAKDLEQSLRAGLRAAQRGMGPVPELFVLDMIQALLETKTEGGPKSGWRVTTRTPTGGRAVNETWFLASEGGKPRLICARACFPEMAREALLLLGKGDTASARLWLDWARALITSLPAEISLFTAFTQAWPAGDEPSPAQIRLAAATLAIGDKSSDLVPVLRAARDAAPPGQQRLALTFSLALDLAELKQWDALLAEAKVLEEQLPSWQGGFELHRRALEQTGRKGELRKLDEERLKLRPDDGFVLRALQLDAMRSGDWAASEKAGQRALELSQGEDRRLALNNFAWLAYCAGRADETAVEQARQAIELSGGVNPAALNTLAALYASLGRVAEARQSLTGLIDKKDEDQLDDGDWYIAGLVAEGDGLPKTALAAYGHIKPEKDPEPDSIAYLAQKHEAAIKAAK